MTNYIPDTNRFALAAPPAWWLAKLKDFDDTLVVIPSRMGYQYRLAQRTKMSFNTKLVHDLANNDDSQMLKTYGLVPVTTIIAQPRWDNPIMFEDLRQRMPSRMGGAEKYEAALLAKEAKIKLDERVERDNMLDVIAKDSLKFYNLKRGVRSHMWSPATKIVDSNRAKSGISPAIRIASPYSKLRG